MDLQTRLFTMLIYAKLNLPANLKQSPEQVCEIFKGDLERDLKYHSDEWNFKQVNLKRLNKLAEEL